MHRTGSALAAVLVTAALWPPPAARAEEGASGHYTPGSYASFIDAFPGKPGVALANYFLYYPASAGTKLPIGGMISAGLDAKVIADSIVVVDQTPLALLGGNYALGAVLPAAWLNLTGTIVAGGTTRSDVQTSSGIADPLLYPFILGWTDLGGDLKYDFRLGIYAPIGKYQVGAIANLGKNYWTFEPTFAISHISIKIGLEASAFVALDFNTKNTATDYQTGHQFHIDATLAEHVPLLGGFIGAGASGFFYKQFTADSGSGAVLGAFEGRTAGVGPVVSYAVKSTGFQGALELKWLPELSVMNRLKGDYFWVKFGAVF